MVVIDRAVIVATGPSLTVEDCRKAERTGRKIYAVNNAYDWITCSVLYACDEEWWDLHEERTRYIPGRWTTNDAAARKYGLSHIPGQHHEPTGKRFDASGHGIIYGSNSGFQAVNLAYIHGVRDIILLGFDLGHGENTPSHCFGEHPPSIHKPSPYHLFLEHWQAAVPEIKAAGVRIRNATRGGRLDCFERCEL